MLRFISVVAIGCLIFPSRALACSCAPPPPVAEHLADADAVFLGELVDEEPDFQPVYPLFFLLFPSPNYRPPDRALTFRVIASWKGVTGTEVGLATYAGGQSCGFFGEIGEEYLLYARTDPDPSKLWVSLCSFEREETAASDIAVLDTLTTRLELVAGDDPTFPPERVGLGLCGLGSFLASQFSMMFLISYRYHSIRLRRFATST